MTDQELRDLVASLSVAHAKTEALQAQTQTELKEATRVLAELGRRMGAMGINLGDVTEEFFYNSLCAKPELGGVVFDTVTSNLVMRSKKSQAEFDIVLANGQTAALIEVKLKAHINDLDQVARQIDLYRQLRPEHSGYKLYGGIAGFSVPPDVLAAAKARGMFVLQRAGDVLETATDSMRAL